MTDLSKLDDDSWEQICSLEELPLDAGVAALINQEPSAINREPSSANQKPSEQCQIALFRQRDSETVYAIGNFDPFSEANVLARGILCSIDGELNVASPVLKEHFSLTTGQCLEDETVSVPTYPTKISDGQVFVQVASSSEVSL